MLVFLPSKRSTTPIRCDQTLGTASAAATREKVAILFPGSFPSSLACRGDGPATHGGELFRYGERPETTTLGISSEAIAEQTVLLKAILKSLQDNKSGTPPEESGDHRSPLIDAPETDTLLESDDSGPPSHEEELAVQRGL